MSYYAEFLAPIWFQNKKEGTRFHDLCKKVPRLFPNLECLYLTITGQIAPDMYRAPAEGIEERILAPVEEMFRTLGLKNGRDFSIAIHRTQWVGLVDKYARLSRLHGSELKVERYREGSGRFWRPLDAEKETGYWVCSGWEHGSFSTVGFRRT